MSAEARPITAAAFAEAIQELELGSLHAKAAELRNSIYHMQRSNTQLAPFAAEGDQDCADAITENDDVMRRYRARIELLKAEVLRRGMPWVEDPREGAADEEPVKEGLQRQQVNGDAGESRTDGANDTATSANRQAEDERLLQMLLQRAAQEGAAAEASSNSNNANNSNDNDEEGVFL